MIQNKKSFIENNTCTLCENGYLIGTSVEKCSCLKSWESSYRLAQLAISSGLKVEDLDYSISDYYGNTKIPKAVSNFIDCFTSSDRDKNSSKRKIYFTGKVNTQKSTVARYIALSLLKKKFVVKYVLMDDLIKTLLNTSSHDPLKKDIADKLINDYKYADFLVLDESFDSERITLYQSGYQIPYLTTFLKERIEIVSKSTLFISNKPVSSIESEGFSEALESLIKRECLVLEFRDCLDDKHAVKTTDFLDIF